ncbi:restriction endonuclease subunit S [Olleya marilimosa]|uniref:restriction endonuclease subunit S n=1 Tax=Olleya marilimosa TaxID=272164 RepID=UPI0030EC3F5F|tara:strand:- start:20459 stop:21586 length:1128 start_codon:yes stop_codon:yes gene_type:complete
MHNVMMEEKVLKLDKSNWVPTKLGELATEISKRVDNPSESEYDRFVSLRCFVSGNIKIKTWEPTENLASSAKAFESGDILFARRNAYLRRASMVDFNGCCSGDAFVLRENHDKVVPGYLAFLLNSNALWDYANSNAAGTMSKRVKWRDLAEYEFLLPPKDLQAKLAELLWAMDEVVERENDILDKNINLRKSQLKETYFTIPIKHRSEKVILEKLIKLSSGKTRPKDLRDKPIDNYVYPVYGGNGIIGYSKDYLIEYDTIVLGRVGEYCGVVHDTSGKIWVSDNALYVKEYLSSIDKYYLSRFLEYIDLNKQQNKSSHPLITQSKVCSNSIPMLSKELMLKQNLKLNGIEELILNLKTKISSSKELQKSLINQVF